MGTNSEARKRDHPCKTELELAQQRIGILEGALGALVPALVLFQEEFEGTPLKELADKAVEVARDAVVWRSKEG
jgi:hypothetical protein